MTRHQEDLAHMQPFWDCLKHLQDLPLGGIIGSVTMDGTFYDPEPDHLIREWIIAFERTLPMMGWDMHIRGLVAREKAFGQYGAGIYGWRLKNPVMFQRPVPARGSLGFWEYPICRSCGCTDHDCRHCIEKTGHPCHWVAEDLCSACEAIIQKKAPFP